MTHAGELHPRMSRRCDDIGAVEQRLAKAATDASDDRRGCVFVAVDDLTAILREFAALRTSYEQRGEALQRIAGTWKE